MLPVFLLIVFTIMDLGLMAFWLIVVNHATYEAARAAALLAGPAPNGSSNGKSYQSAASDIVKSFFPNARVTVTSEGTVTDPQSGTPNADIIVKTVFDIQYSFPMSNILLSSPPACKSSPGPGKCTYSTTVRMPIEQPASK